MSDVKYVPAKYNKGKNPDNPRNLLPVLPTVRSKPIWQANLPSFELTGKPPEDEVEDLNVMQQLKTRDLRKVKKRKIRTKSWDPEQTDGKSGKGFSYPRKDRESFRNALVNIIMQQEKDDSRPLSTDTDALVLTTRAGSPTAAEKDILRYYYYIHNGIDTEHVAPMEDSWLENVKRLVSEDLKAGHALTIENLSDEMRDDYLLSVKKAIVDFVLRDPREKSEDKKEELTEARSELAVVPKPWKKSFLCAQTQITQDLNVTNPTMLQVLELWHVSFGKLRLVDIEEFHKKPESMELAIFQNLVMRHIESAKEKLLKKWFPEVQNIYYQGNRRKLVPSNHNGRKLESFFNSAATLMTAQLQMLCLESIQDFTDLICQPEESTRAYEHSGFIQRLVLDGTDIKFEPTFSDFEIVLLNVYDVMLKAIGVIPRVETKLYSEWNGPKKKKVPTATLR